MILKHSEAIRFYTVKFRAQTPLYLHPLGHMPPERVLQYKCLSPVPFSPADPWGNPISLCQAPGLGTMCYAVDLFFSWLIGSISGFALW